MSALTDAEKTQIVETVKKRPPIEFFIVKGAWPGAGPTATYNRFGTVVAGNDKLQAITSTDKINSITIAVT